MLKSGASSLYTQPSPKDGYILLKYDLCKNSISLPANLPNRYA